MTFPLGETVVLHSRTLAAEPDSDGNDVWTDANTTLNAAVYPRFSSELVQGQDTNIIGLTAVFKPAVTVTPTDELTVRGERWRIDGMPGQYNSPLTGSTLTQVHLTRVTG